MVGTRRLIFHFYINKNWKQNPIYWVHKYFLKKYSQIFDEALFIISRDADCSVETVKEAEKFLIDCEFKNIEFRTEQNNGLCEVETFNKYVLQRLKSLNGVTFFGHTKGITNYYNPKMNKEAVFLWISSLYYLGLQYYKEAEWAIYTAGSCFFGGPSLFEDGKMTYSGTFYWLNGLKIFDKINGVYPQIKDRFYAERFPSLINCDNPYDYDCYSHNYMMVDKRIITENMFKSLDVAEKYVNALLSVEEVNDFYSVVNEAKKYLLENGINY